MAAVHVFMKVACMEMISGVVAEECASWLFAVNGHGDFHSHPADFGSRCLLIDCGSLLSLFVVEMFNSDFGATKVLEVEQSCVVVLAVGRCSGVASPVQSWS